MKQRQTDRQREAKRRGGGGGGTDRQTDRETVCFTVLMWHSTVGRALKIQLLKLCSSYVSHRIRSPHSHRIFEHLFSSFSLFCFSLTHCSGVRLIILIVFPLTKLAVYLQDVITIVQKAAAAAAATAVETVPLPAATQVKVKQVCGSVPSVVQSI